MQDFLNGTFLHWIDCRKTIESLPLSPDLTPCDFYLWGIVKDRVYIQNSRDVNRLKSLIEQEFTLVNYNIELCQAICRSVADRCQMWKNKEGKQSEQLR